jgi:hypothetical protein
MSDNYIQEAFKRIEEMCQEALNAQLGYDIDVILWPHSQEKKPYITLRLAPMTNNPSDLSEDLQIYERMCFMRLVTGHVTEGKVDEVQDKTHIYIVLLEDYLRGLNSMLFTDAGTYADEGPDWLFNRQPLLADDTGLVVFLNSGIGQNQVGCQFSLRLHYLRSAY